MAANHSGLDHPCFGWFITVLTWRQHRSALSRVRAGRSSFLKPGSCGGAPAAAADTGPARGAATEDNPIAAVLVFKDPTDWYRDVQLVLDVVMSGDGSCCRRGCCASPSPANHSVRP